MEYKVVKIKLAGWVSAKIDANEFQDKLNEWAREGWELVNTVALHENDGRTSDLLVTLKRNLR